MSCTDSAFLPMAIWAAYFSHIHTQHEPQQETMSIHSHIVHSDALSVSIRFYTHYESQLFMVKLNSLVIKLSIYWIVFFSAHTMNRSTPFCSGGPLQLQAFREAKKIELADPPSAGLSHQWVYGSLKHQNIIYCLLLSCFTSMSSNMIWYRSFVI